MYGRSFLSPLHLSKPRTYTYRLLRPLPTRRRYGSVPARIAGLSRQRFQAQMMAPRASDREDRISRAPRRSGLSRNVPEEKLNRPRFIDEDDGCSLCAVCLGNGGPYALLNVTRGDLF